MTRPLLALFTGAVALGTGLCTAWVQCSNQALAGRLDELTRECAWLERCALEHRQRIATAAFETERWIASPRKARPASDASELEPGASWSEADA